MTHPYATAEYAATLAHAGVPVPVPEWGCSVLKREISPGLFDAMGTYPLVVLSRDADIAAGLERLRGEGFVSVVLVVDDFHRPELEALKAYFPHFKPYKTHYIYRPERGGIVYDTHHRRALKRADAIQTSVLDFPKEVDRWSALYDALTERLKLTGLHAFPHTHHRALAKLEGVTAIGGWHDGELVSCHVWVQADGYVHSHLTASNGHGYAMQAAYAVSDASLKHFAKAKLINMGGGAGMTDDANDGLARFKRGFSNGTAKSYICGAVLDKARYAELVIQRGKITSEFFPAYRAPASHTA